MESQPQNPEFRNNPENFHACIRFGYLIALSISKGSYEPALMRRRVSLRCSHGQCMDIDEDSDQI